MIYKSKPQLKQALARIMERAKAYRDLTSAPSDSLAYAEIAKIAYEALDEPSMADVAAYLNLREPASKKRKKEKI